MIRYLIVITLIFISVISCDEKESLNECNVCNDAQSLTAREYHVLINKGTEIPFSGELLNVKEDGIYTCKICGTPLFYSEAKFNSGTGWPSFDDAIKENIKLIPDGDRIEVVCAKCGGHMGHVFYGEGFTEKETRYCINSVSLNFVNKFTNENNENSENK